MFGLKQLQAKHCLSVLLWLVASSVAPAAVAYHPADVNQDRVITQDELTAYTKAWTQHQSWPTGPSPISRVYLNRAEFIWRHGERYRTISGVPEPLGWVPSSTNGPTYTALGTAAAQPFQAVAVYGVSLSSNVTATFTVDGLPGIYPAAVRQGSLGHWSLVVPVNPSNFEGQGTVEFQLTDAASGNTYETPPLKLESLPAAPGSTQQFLDQAEQTLHQIVSNDGYNLDVLVTEDLTQVPLELRPIVFAERMLAGPNNPYSLKAFLAGTTPGYGGSSQSIALVDRIIAASGLTNLVPVTATGATVASQGVGLMGTPVPMGSPVIPSGSTYPVARLSVDMKYQASEEQMIQNPYNLEDGAGVALKGFSIYKVLTGAISVKTFIPGSTVSSALAVTFLVHKVFEHYWAGVLPNRFTDMKLSIVQGPSRGYFLEDGEGNASNGCEEADFKAMATVKSKGFDLGKALIQIYNPSLPSGLPPGVPAPTSLSMAQKVQLYQWIRQELPDSTLGNVPARTWQSDVTDPYYSTVTSDIFGVGFDDQNMDYLFYPEAVGGGTVTVTMIPKQFGGHSISGSLNYETRPIQVVIENPVTNVSGTGPITYTAVLKDAFHKGPNDLAWSVSAGSIDSTKQTTDGSYQMTWTPPAEKSLFPVTITAQSTTRACLRKDGLPPRQAEINVCSAGFRILPNLAFIAEGAQEQFQVEACDGTSPAVSWKILSGPGTLTQDGLYSAPQTTGTVTIEATGISQTNEQATATIQIVSPDSFLVFWQLASSSFPPVEGSPDAGFGGVLISPVGATVGTNSLPDSILMGLYVTYDTLAQPVGQQKYPTAKGHFVGAGLYLPGSLQEEKSLEDDSRADVTYLDSVGSKYQVHAGFNLSVDNSNYDSIALDGGPQGTQMHIHFTSSSLDSYADPTYRYPENKVSVSWKFSNGFEASGTNVIYTCRRDLHSFKVTVVATDLLGNSAQMTRTFLVVQTAGQFALPYDPTGHPLECMYWPSTLPPPPPSSSGTNFVTTLSPTNCQATLTLTGARTGDVTAAGLSETGLAPTAKGTRFTTTFTSTAVP